MNEKVRAFLETKKAEEKRMFEEEKQEKLVAIGLCDKVYSPNNTYNEEYPLSEWDEDSSKYKYFKVIPVEITNEEYEEVKKYTNTSDNSRTNIIATILTIIAWIIFLGGFFAGISLGNVVVDPHDVIDGTKFSFAIALTYWSVSLISGIIILAFAEIIKILDDIKRK